jgi:hypothetical protein
MERIPQRNTKNRLHNDAGGIKSQSIQKPRWLITKQNKRAEHDLKIGECHVITGQAPTQPRNTLQSVLKPYSK